MIRHAASAQLVVPVSDFDHSLGSKTAPVTLVEYGDYQCPACGQAYPIVKELLRQAGHLVRFVFRNFPLTNVHPQAQIAAEAAEAAGDQDRFWPMHDMLYGNQEALDEEDLVDYASALGLDAARFVRDLTKHTHATRVRDDFMGGVRSGVNGTPTFFINNQRHDGPFDLSSLLQAIDSRRTAHGG